jgi:hypothetical protein
MMNQSGVTAGELISFIVHWLRAIFPIIGIAASPNSHRAVIGRKRPLHRPTWRAVEPSLNPRPSLSQKEGGAFRAAQSFPS